MLRRVYSVDQKATASIAHIFKTLEIDFHDFC